jgi:hypothetical protein
MHWNQSAEAINSDDSAEQHDQDNTGKEHKFFTLDSRWSMYSSMFSGTLSLPGYMILAHKD